MTIYKLGLQSSLTGMSTTINGEPQYEILYIAAESLEDAIAKVRETSYKAELKVIEELSTLET